MKILLDLSRYVASLAYRLHLQVLVDSIVNAEPSAPPQDVILVAHSLGSVIAVDSLVNSKAWREDDTVTLVTLGCPLARFFYRFFPGLYFPKTAQACAEVIANRVKAFRWLNCYRPKDYVGTKISLPTDSWTAEVNTGERLKFHAKYWQDTVVRDCILSKLTLMLYSRPKESHDCSWQSDYFAPAPKIVEAVEGKVQLFLLEKLPLYVAIAASLFAVGDAHRLYSDRVEHLNETIKSGIRLDAKVSYVDTSGADYTSFIYTVKYRPIKASKELVWTGGTVGLDGVFDPLYWKFNPSSLKGAIAAAGCSQLCIDIPMKVKYQPSQEDYFVIVGSEPSFGISDYVISIGYLIFVVVVGMTCPPRSAHTQV